ncbi:hypothetical protein LMG9449_2570 [Lactococcus lactis subsp. lactis]|uniref:Uncharacterized protein n=1 Tax=Lactococcus lactis subsp. lactis TaxID=1360 RepID=A0A0V8DLS4_LACLL|nr:hypothetical protein LMG9449_2570 [Lactococcus lactis subsp. lactis]
MEIEPKQKGVFLKFEKVILENLNSPKSPFLNSHDFSEMGFLY